jgi:riboflavin synthase
MFTGLVESLAPVVALIDEPPGKRLILDAPMITAGAQIGDSIAINGCCLTVTAVEGSRLSFQAGSETLSRTNLGRLAPGSLVNLERSLCMGDRIGGHFVTGHIDGPGALDRREDEGDWAKLWFRVDASLARQMASKGSVAVDGVSLTLVDVTDTQFSVALIPHTLAVTTLGRLRAGDRVNIETDLLAKYIERQLAAQSQ